MSTQSIINQFQTQPKAIQEMVATALIVQDTGLRLDAVRRVLFPPGNDSPDRWNRLLDVADSLGILVGDPPRVEVEEALDDRRFGKLLRRRFREEERIRGMNSLVYVAYRAALEVGPNVDGATGTRDLIDRAEERARRLLGPTQVRRYDEDKMRPWRWWVTASGLGFMRSLQDYIICPAVALWDEVEAWGERSTEMPVADFIDALDDVPLLADGPAESRSLSAGTAAAFRILEAQGAIKLVHTADAAGEWDMPDRTKVTHVRMLRQAVP